MTSDSFGGGKRHARNHGNFVQNDAVSRIQALGNSTVANRLVDRCRRTTLENPQAEVAVKRSSAHNHCGGTRAGQHGIAQLDLAAKTIDEKTFARAGLSREENVVQSPEQVHGCFLAAGEFHFRKDIPANRHHDETITWFNLIGLGALNWKTGCTVRECA